MTSVLCIRSSTGLYGAESVLLDLLPALRDCRVSAGLACIQDYAGDNQELYRAALARDIEVALIPCRSRFDRGTIRGLRKLIAEKRINLVQTNDPKSTLFGLLAVRGLGIPVVATLHGWVDTTWRLRIYNRLEALLLRLCSAVVVVADQMVRRLGQAGVGRDKAVVIGNGVDTERFAPREKLSPRLTILTVARLTPEKGLDILIRAFAKARTELDELHLRIAGAGPLRAELEALAQREGVAGSVEFLGFVSRPEDLYAEADCYVCSSHTEGMPISVLEAMASGLPVVATSVGSLPDVVGKCDCGALVAAGDADGLATALVSLLQSSDRRAELGRHAVECARKKFSLAAQAGAYARLFERVGQASPRMTEAQL